MVRAARHRSYRSARCWPAWRRNTPAGKSPAGKFFAMGCGPMRAVAGKEPLFAELGHQRAFGSRRRRARNGQAAPSRSLPADRRTVPGDARPCDAAGRAHGQPRRHGASGRPLGRNGAAQTARAGLRPHERRQRLRHRAAAAGCRRRPGRHRPHERRDPLRRRRSRSGSATTMPGWPRSARKIPSSASPDFGEPFAAIFERAGRDFYKIDPHALQPGRRDAGESRQRQDVIALASCGRTCSLGRLLLDHFSTARQEPRLPDSRPLTSISARCASPSSPLPIAGICAICARAAGCAARGRAAAVLARSARAIDADGKLAIYSAGQRPGELRRGARPHDAAGVARAGRLSDGLPRAAAKRRAAWSSIRRAAVEAAVDKYLTSAKLAAAGLCNAADDLLPDGGRRDGRL